MHGGDEIIIVCVKYMAETLAKTFVGNTNGAELARSLRQSSNAHGTADCDMAHGFDEARRSYFVEIRFYMEIVDTENVEKWCSREGFEITEKTFGSHL